MIATLTFALLCASLTWSFAARAGVGTKNLDAVGVAHPPQLSIHLNEAPWYELTLLPGISRTMAKRIVESRQQEGPFVRLAELQRVRGIGPRRLARLTPLLHLGADR